MPVHHDQLVILDFDSTLFSVEKFIDDLPNVVEELCDIPATRFHETYEQAKKKSGSYNFYDHSTILGISLADAEHILTPAHFIRDYSYPGLCETIERFKKNADMIIWTLGHPRFQNFKKSLILCIADIPFLAEEKVNERSKGDLPHQIILTPEHAMYNDKIYKKVVMIDDRPRNFFNNPQSYMRQIRVRYLDGRYSHIETPAGVEEVTNLTEITV